MVEVLELYLRIAVSCSRALAFGRERGRERESSLLPFHTTQRSLSSLIHALNIAPCSDTPPARPAHSASWTMSPSHSADARPRVTIGLLRLCQAPALAQGSRGWRGGGWGSTGKRVAQTILTNSRCQSHVSLAHRCLLAVAGSRYEGAGGEAALLKNGVVG